MSANWPSGDSPSDWDRAATQTAAHATLKVSHADGKPILFLPGQPERDDLPEGWTDVDADGETLSANFVKVAINVAHRPGETTNVLPEVLRRWFGEDAGAPGTRHAVALERVGATWRMEPIGVRRDRLQLWRSYSREEIPKLFGFPFSTAIWNAGFVKRPGHIFLLATLDKAGHGSAFRVQGPLHQPNRVRVAEPESNVTGQQ